MPALPALPAVRAQARVEGVVYGARNRLLGADGSWISMLPREEEEGPGPSWGGAEAGDCTCGPSRNSGYASDDSAPAEPAGGAAAGCDCGRLHVPHVPHVGNAASCSGLAAEGSGSGGDEQRGQAGWAAAAEIAAGAAGGPGPPAPRHPFHPGLQVVRGVLGQECSALMKEFFRARRRDSSWDSDGSGGGNGSGSGSEEEGEGPARRW